MCLSIPMKLTEGDEFTGVAEVDGVQREVSLVLLPEAAAVGDWVLVHAGHAIAKVDEEEAERTLSLLREAAEKGVVDWGESR